MTDAVTQTSDQTTDQPAAEPTLEDVYKTVDFGTTEPVQQQTQVQQQPIQQQTTQQATPSVPDPYDTENFKAYMARKEAETTELRQATSQLVSHLTNAQAQEAKRVMEADIQAAVKTVNEVVGHSKPKVIEAMLDAKAREDSKFKALWNNRSKNPAAWNNALKAVAREFSNDLQVVRDPQLTRSQQALKLSQQQMATTQREEPDDSWNNLSEADFSRKWEGMVNRGF